MGKASLVFNLPVPLLLPPDMKCLFVFFFFLQDLLLVPERADRPRLYLRTVKLVDFGL